MISKLLPSTSARAIAICSAACVMLTCTGCGGTPDDQPIRAAVSGTVTLDGAPLPEGVIRFIPAQGTTGPQTTAVISEGTFELSENQGPVVGMHRVEIESSDTGGLAMDDEQALVRLSSERRKPRIKVVRVPPIYNRQSQLVAEIPEQGATGLSYELVSKHR